MEKKMKIKAGAAATCITPSTTQFLYGYPHVERYSTGVDTPLYSSALFLDDGTKKLLMISHDLLYFDKETVKTIREKIRVRTSIPGDCVMVTASHTHSGPITVNRVGNEKNSVIPPRDENYLSWVVDQVVENAVKAVNSACFAEIGLAKADSSQVGCNRRDPSGAKNSDVPVMVVRSAEEKKAIAVMMVVCIHPTVLHQDSNLISADFPGYTRKRLQEELGDIPVIYHSGPSGNQSPRHLTRENTPREAKRLGDILAESALSGIKDIEFTSDITLKSNRTEVELPFNYFPSVEEAEKIEKDVREKLNRMREAGDDPKQTRTVECDWFGAERRLVLAKMNASGELKKQAAEKALPAEVQVFKIGEWIFSAWPGEVFVEFGLEVKAKAPNSFPIAYANGETQGYLVTKEAVAEGGYEASLGVFKSPDSPELLVSKTLELIAGL